jgi:hypothetical protein
MRTEPKRIIYFSILLLLFLTDPVSFSKNARQKRNPFSAYSLNEKNLFAGKGFENNISRF